MFMLLLKAVVVFRRDVGSRETHIDLIHKLHLRQCQVTTGLSAISRMIVPVVYRQFNRRAYV